MNSKNAHTITDKFAEYSFINVYREMKTMCIGYTIYDIHTNR